MYGTAKQRKQERQRSADERQAAYDALTLEEKVDRAHARGHGQTREYKRLFAQLRAQS